MLEQLVMKNKMDRSLTKMSKKYPVQLCMLVFWIAGFAQDFQGNYLQLASKQAENAHGAP